MANTPIAVLFRFAPDPFDSVTAIFPYEPYSPNLPNVVTCYAHIGQHGSADLGYLRRTRPATPAEYASLLRELQTIGYDVTIVHRVNYRRAAAAFTAMLARHLAAAASA